MTENESLDRATFAGGCFWCIEAAFEELEGVVQATSGYTGGATENPTYEAVCSGETGHAEAVQVTYDPSAVSYPALLEVFFTVHDPTTPNRQGPDVGTQYRSAVFYHDEDQREEVDGYVEELEAEGVFADPIVTEVEPLGEFYEAEAYHQDYYEKAKASEGNTNTGYCYRYIPPKLEKVREKFPDKVKQEAESTDD